MKDLFKEYKELLEFAFIINILSLVLALCIKGFGHLTAHLMSISLLKLLLVFLIFSIGFIISGFIVTICFSLISFIWKKLF